MPASKYEKFSMAPFGVQKRYFQIKFTRQTSFVARFYLRIYLTVKEFEKYRVLRKTLKSLKRETIRARKEGNECTQVLMNMGLYLLIALTDIQTVKIDALCHHNEWKRLISLRLILVTIYEWDISKASSGNLKLLLSRSSVDENLQAELFSALRALRKSREKAAKMLRLERNSIIAHRDPDALLQLNTIENMSPTRVYILARDFYRSTNLFIDVLPKVIGQAGSTHGLLSFALNKQK